MSAPRRRRVAVRVLRLAELGHAHWFFGNLYEAIVKVPELVASQARGSEQAMSPTGPGSPVRYYAAGAPATVPAIVAAAASGWRDRASRPWLAAAAACSISGTVATVYLVRTVNLKLFFSNEALTAAEQERLLRKWYRVNAGRLALVGGAWVASRVAAAQLSK